MLSFSGWMFLAAMQWQPPCQAPISFGDGLPLACDSDQAVSIETPYFRATVPAGMRYGVCADGSCLEVRARQVRPPVAFSVHRGALERQLAGVNDLETLGERLSGPMRPCEMSEVEGVRWLHCRHDFDTHLAAERLEEGDYYQLVGDYWLGLRYTLSKDESLTVFRHRFGQLLSSLEPVRTAR